MDKTDFLKNTALNSKLSKSKFKSKLKIQNCPKCTGGLSIVFKGNIEIGLG